MKNNKIIAISGQPVTGKGTTVKAIIEKLKEQGYSEEAIHVISTGVEFRNYFNAISKFIAHYQDPEEMEKLAQDPYLKVFFEKGKYREALIDTILKLKQSEVDINSLSIEQANNLKEYSALRKVIDKIIDEGMAEKGREINSESRPNEIWLIDSRLAFSNIPSAFSVRLTATPQVSAERLLNDKSRGKEDNQYETIQEALIAREKRRKGEQARYLKRYGVDLENDDNYDLIIDTSFATIEDISSTILTCLDYYTHGKGFVKKWTSPKTLLPLQNERATLAKGTSSLNLEEFQEMVKENGYSPDIPILIIEVDGRRYIIEGHHRTFSSARLEKTLVPYEVIAKDDEEIPLYGRIARDRAKDLSIEYLYGHEWLIGESFSYNEVYPGIYEELSKQPEER